LSQETNQIPQQTVKFAAPSGATGPVIFHHRGRILMTYSNPEKVFVCINEQPSQKQPPPKIYALLTTRRLNNNNSTCFCFKHPFVKSLLVSGDDWMVVCLVS